MTTMYDSRARDRALQVIHESRAGMWVVCLAPSSRELDRLAIDFDLDRDNLEDAVDIYESPRVEVKGDAVYIYTRYCHPEGKEIATEPLLIVHTSQYVFTIVRSETSILSRLTRDELEF